MSYRIVFERKAEKQLDKLSEFDRSRILKYLHRHIDGIDNPRKLGDALNGKWGEYWKYRIGAYRIICDIQDAELIIVAVEIGHRSKIYKSNS